MSSYSVKLKMWPVKYQYLSFETAVELLACTFKRWLFDQGLTIPSGDSDFKRVLFVVLTVNLM